MPRSIVRMSTKLLAVFAVAALLLAVEGSPAIAAAYPPKLQKAFVSGCTKGAKSQGVAKGTAKTYCKADLKCLEAHFTLKQFEALIKRPKRAVHNATVKRCAKQAAASVS